jgi:hypothetical protein
MRLKFFRTLLILIALYNPISTMASEVVGFTKSFVESISLYQRAINHKNETHPNNSNLQATMKVFVTYIDEIKAAKRYMVDFEKSPNKEIATASNLLCDGYDNIIANQYNMLDALEELGNNPNNFLKQGSLDRMLAEYEVKEHQGALSLMAITGEVSDTLIDDKRLQDDKIMFLKLTNAERASIKELLVREFGKETLTSKRNKSGAEASASGLWDFLSNSWKSADEK